jgi:hypothetical protein
VVLIDPVFDQLPVAESYSSAAERPPLTEDPPATRTRPLARSVAVNDERASAIEPVDVQTPVAGSNISAVLSAVKLKS